MRDRRTLWVDMSWLLFKNWHSRGSLSITEVSRDDEGYEIFTDIPTGHIYGCLQNIAQAAGVYDRVILALDGGKQYRRDIYPEYKAGRKPLDYPIFKDQPTILKMAMHFPNVYFAKAEGYEADDVIATAMLAPEPIVLWLRDRDIMQTRGNWSVLEHIDQGEPVYMDVPAYLQKETDLVGMTHLPPTYKVIRGDTSDKIPPSIPRLPFTKLAPLVLALQDVYDYEAIRSHLQRELVDNKAWKNPIDWEAVHRNYRLIMPRYLPEDQRRIFRSAPDVNWLVERMNYYRFNSLAGYFFPQ